MSSAAAATGATRAPLCHADPMPGSVALPAGPGGVSVPCPTPLPAPLSLNRNQVFALLLAPGAAAIAVALVLLRLDFQPPSVPPYRIEPPPGADPAVLE